MPLNIFSIALFAACVNKVGDDIVPAKNKKARRRCRREQKKLDCERYFDLFVLRSLIIDMSAQRLAFTLATRKIFCQSIGDGTVLCGQIDATEDKYAANSLGDEKLFVKKQPPRR